MKTILKPIFMQILITQTLLSNFHFSENHIKFEHITIEQGHYSNTVRCIFQDSKGFLWFGTYDGSNKFDGVEHRLQNVVKFDKDISQIKDLQLSYKDNSFSLEFAALDFLQSQKNQYAYNLEGFDQDRIYIGSRNYTNFDPGTYIFKVKNSNNDGFRNEEGTSLKVRITPPFWKTWWFRIISFITISFLIFIFYRIIMQSISKRNKILEEINLKLNRQIKERKRVERLLQAMNNAALAMERAWTPEEIFQAVAGEFNKLNFSCIIFQADLKERTLIPKYISYESRIIKDTENCVGIKHSIPYEKVETFMKTICERKTIFEEDVEKWTQQILPNTVKNFTGQIVRLLRISKSILSPLIVEDNVTGVLAVLSKDLTQNDIPLITAFSYQVAAALRKAELMQDLERNLTERKKAEEQIIKSLQEKEILLKEIHHRVKNNLQVISSMLNLQSQHIKNEQIHEMFRESKDRIRSMALIHEKLYRSQDLAKIDFEEYIKSLSKALYRSYGVNPGRITLEVNVKDVSLGIDSAVPCGLIINELVSNSLKHAFPPSWNGKGKIRISFQPHKNNKIKLIIQDNGIGMPKNFNFSHPESLGLRLVTILVRDQLEGKIDMERERGTKFRIILNRMKNRDKRLEA